MLERQYVNVCTVSTDTVFYSDKDFRWIGGGEVMWTKVALSARD